jgi:hypothetical protein
MYVNKVTATNQDIWALSGYNETIELAAGANNDNVLARDGNLTVRWETGSGNDTINTQPDPFVTPGQETLPFAAGLTVDSLTTW